MADGTESQVSDNSGADSPAESQKSTDAQFLNADTDRVARIVAALRKAHAEQAAASPAPAAMAPVPAPPAETVAESVSEPVAKSAAESVAGSVSESVSDDAVTQTAEIPDAPAPRRETSGVRPAAPNLPTLPTLRWNPGARYRASRLADRPALSAASVAEPATPASGPAGQLPVPPPPVPGPPVQGPPVPAPPVQGPPVPPHPAPAHPVAGPPPLAGRLYRGPARRTGVFEREIWYPATRSSRVPRDVSDALVRAVERYRMGSISTSGLVHAIGRAHAA